MAVFKQELNWSTYQDKQLNVLQNLEKSFSSSLQSSVHIRNSLASISTSVDIIAKSIVEGYTRSMSDFQRATQTSSSIITNASRSTAQAYNEQGTILDNAGKVIYSVVQEMMDQQSQIEEAQKELDRIAEEERRQKAENRKKDMEHAKAVDDATDLVVSGLNFLASKLNAIGKEADIFSSVNNNLVRITGQGKEVLQDFRADIRSELQDLNKDTGYYYNFQESYSTVASVMQGVTGNTSAMKTMSKSILLAQETLDVNLSTIASIFNNFYTRYSFSSAAMEDMIGDIRKYSAGSAATGEEIVRAQMALENIVEYYANGDEDKLVAYNEQIAKMVGFYENSGFDPEIFMSDLLKKVEGGEFTQDSALVAAFNKAGYSATDILSKSKDPLQYEEITNAYLKGIREIYRSVEGEDILTRDLALQAYGLDTENAMAIRNFVERMEKNNGSLEQAFEEYVNTRDDTPITELVDDKFNTLMDKLNNWFNPIYSYLATAQETTGIGWTDAAKFLGTIAAGVTTIATISKLNSTLDNISKVLGNGSGGEAAANVAQSIGSILGKSGDASASALKNIASALGKGTGGTGGIAGLLGKAGGALGKIGGALGATGGGAIAAGAGTTIGVLLLLYGIGKGISDTVKEIKRENQEHANDLAEATKAAGTDSLLMMEEYLDVDEKGNAVARYDYKSVSPEEFDLETHTKNLVKKNEQSIADHQANEWYKELPSWLLLQNSDFDSFWDYVPIVGKITQLIEDSAGKKQANDEFLRDQRYSKFVNNLSLSERELLNAYYGAYNGGHALIKDDVQQIDFLLGHWSEILALHDEGLALSSMSEKGLKNPVDSKKLIGYDEGTNYVTQDQVAVIHEGEAVVPKRYNPMANMNELEALREKDTHKEEMSNRHLDERVAETVSTLREILSFLGEWKYSSELSTMESKRNDRLSSNSLILNRYFQGV